MLARQCRDALEGCAAELRLRRLSAWVLAREPDSMRFAKAFGFRMEHIDTGSAPDRSDLVLMVKRWSR